MSDENIRLAIIDLDRCKPKKCHKECKNCPINRSGKTCVKVTPEKCAISESLCIGCGICVRNCPLKAIQIINLPKSLDSETSHRYSRNGFKLHRLPIPRKKQVLGLVGQNGIGKSTALQILNSKIKPNLGIYDKKNEPDWDTIITKFRGSELQAYLTQHLHGNLKVKTKPQWVDNLAKIKRGNVGEMLRESDQNGKFDSIIPQLQLQNLLQRSLQQLSGGELQRFAIAIVALSDVGAYFFDEPSSYLDIGQRIACARVIRDCLDVGDYVIVIEHDLAILDYMSDYISVLYGQPGAYGVISDPFSVSVGINNFLDGYIPTENMRFRQDALTFVIKDDEEEIQLEGQIQSFNYPTMSVNFDGFELKVEKGHFNRAELIVLLGQNGVGKTTFIRILAGNQEANVGSSSETAKFQMPGLTVSYKPQKIQPKFTGNVQELLQMKIGSSLTQPNFKDMVLNQLELEHLYDREVKSLSGGELQRVAIVLALGKNADIYLIDEPSAFLDAEQRVIIAKVIKRYILSTRKTAFIVEHDFIMATYLASRVVVFDGTPGVSTTASRPQPLIKGMNEFLRQMSVTLRADPTTKRPRINKYNSNKDKSQKQAGTYFVIAD